MARGARAWHICASNPGVEPDLRAGKGCFGSAPFHSFKVLHPLPACRQKRKADEDAYVGSKSARSDVGENPGEEPDTCDLIVLGLPYKTTENEMRKYFSEFGEVMMCQLKTQANGVSKGFGFVRFRDPEVQNKVFAIDLSISWVLHESVQYLRHSCSCRSGDHDAPHGRGPLVRRQNTRLARTRPGEKRARLQDLRGKVRQKSVSGGCVSFYDTSLTSRLTESITAEDLKNHFEAFGKVTDVFYPKPFRGFAFVTFVEAK